MHGLFEVDGVQDFQLVTVFQKCVPALDHDTTFRVSDHIGTTVSYTHLYIKRLSATTITSFRKIWADSLLM